MDLGCPLLRGSSDRRLRRCAATGGSINQEKFLKWKPGGFLKFVTKILQKDLTKILQECVSCKNLTRQGIPYKTLATIAKKTIIPKNLILNVCLYWKNSVSCWSQTNHIEKKMKS